MSEPRHRRQADPGAHEVCFLIGDGGTVLWADGSGDPAAIHDSLTRWQMIWDYRGRLAEITHSHPHGPLAFSPTDLATREAVEAALGRPLTWSVVAPSGMLRSHHGGGATRETAEPWWAGLLRAASGIPQPTYTTLAAGLEHIVRPRRRDPRGVNHKGAA